jgi:high-affinity nickel-transport protein
MDQLPQTWTALCALALLLGMRHGLDADHLAAIDGLTRANASRHPALARATGWLFSAGHGVVVLIVALITMLIANRWQTPEWLAFFGAVVSIAVLFALAARNLHAVLTTGPDRLVHPSGMRARALRPLLTARHPIAVAVVGALFAISFDTVSLAALFAVGAAQFGGTLHVVVVAGAFVCGMAVVDGVNGWWVQRLVARASRRAASASRIMTLAIAAVSASIGCIALARLAHPAMAAWTARHDLALTGLVLATVACAFMLAMAATRRAPTRAGESNPR